MGSKRIDIDVTGKNSAKSALNSAGRDVQTLGKEAQKTGQTIGSSIGHGVNTATSGFSKLRSVGGSTFGSLNSLAGKTGSTIGSAISRGASIGSTAISRMGSVASRTLGTIKAGASAASKSLGDMGTLVAGIAGGLGAMQVAQAIWTGSTQAQFNQMFLATKIGSAAAATWIDQIKTLVSQVPGDDTFMNQIMTGALAKQTNMTMGEMKLLGYATADYLATAQAMGKSSIEAQQDLKEYILTGQTGGFIRGSPLTAYIDELKKGGDTVQSRVTALNNALDKAGYKGISSLQTAQLEWEQILGKLQLVATNIGTKILPYVQQFFEWVLKTDDKTGGLVSTLGFVAGAVLLVGIAMAPLVTATASAATAMALYRKEAQGAAIANALDKGPGNVITNSAQMTPIAKTGVMGATSFATMSIASIATLSVAGIGSFILQGEIANYVDNANKKTPGFGAARTTTAVLNPMQSSMQGMYDYVKTFWTELFSGVDLGTALKDALNNGLTMGLSEWFGNIKPIDMGIGLWKGIEGFVKEKLGIAFAGIQSFLDPIIGPLEGIWDMLKPSIDELKSAFGEVGSAFGELYGAAKEVWGAFSEIGGAIGEVISAFASIFTSTDDTEAPIKDVGEAAKTAGPSLKGLADWIVSMKPYIQEFSGWIHDAAVKIHGVASWIHKLSNVVKDFSDWVKRSVQPIKDFAERIKKIKLPDFKIPTLGSISKWIRDRIPKLPWHIPTLGSIGKWIRDKVNWLRWHIPGIGSIAQWIKDKINWLIWKIPGAPEILSAITSFITPFTWPWGPRPSGSPGTGSGGGGGGAFGPPRGPLTSAVTSTMSDKSGVSQGYVNQGMAANFSGISGFTPIANSLSDHLAYQFYFGDQKSNSAVWSSGTCNCVDGAQLLEAEAPRMGLSAGQASGVWDGTNIGHVWSMIGGVPFDMAAKLLRGQWNPPSGPSLGMSKFMQDIGPGLEYKGYGGHKTDGISALLNGGNCFDMTLGLLQTADKIGVPNKMVWGNWDGQSHVWANIAGTDYDPSRMALQGTWNPPPQGPNITYNNPSGPSGGLRDVVLKIEGDVNGIEDFETKMTKVVRKVLNKDFG
jgi:hypothetical protein